MCYSLSTALLNIDSNTIINITSESVALNNTTTMGSGKLTNITITGSNVTIMCNNSGSIYCRSCDNVRIVGMTWDRCGNPNETNISGVTFNITSNISLVNCTFQNSQLPAVALTEIADNVLIQSCIFLSIILMKEKNNGILNITRTLDLSRFLKSSRIKIMIFEVYFCNNGILQNRTVAHSKSLLSLYIDSKVINDCEVILKKSIFMCNRYHAIFITVHVMEMINIQLKEVLVCNNTFFSYGGGVHILGTIGASYYGNYGDNA